MKNEGAFKKAVIITGPGFQDEEYIYPYYRLLEANIAVDVATKDKQIVYGKYGNPAKPTIDVSFLNADQYDAVVLPGGFEAPDRVRLIPEVIKFIQDMDNCKKLIAAICHGPWILITANVCRGVKMTGFWSIEMDLKNAGADYQHKAPVVIDRHFITSPHYDNNADFMRAVIQYMKN